MHAMKVWQVALLPQGASAPVLLFSKLNKLFFRYFDPEKIFLDDKNK